MSDTQTPVQNPVLLYTEQTPNPESLKFVTNRMLFANNNADFRDETLAIDWSPLAAAIFALPYAKGVYICNNFVTVTKEFNYEWSEVMLPLKQFVKDYLEAGGKVLKDGYLDFKAATEKKDDAVYEGDEAAIVTKIKDLIETYVKPAVESDGGNIEFKAYDAGVVTVVLQGSCSGCPSSTVTLKQGIEGMLKRMVPQVTSVVAEAE